MTLLSLTTTSPSAAVDPAIALKHAINYAAATSGEPVPHLDHRRMTPPSLTLVTEHPTPAGDTVALWHLRVSSPNVAHIPPDVVHSVEHFLIYLLAEEPGPVVAAAPMGCQTGYYILAVNLTDFPAMADLVATALEKITTATSVPYATTRDCGWAENHSLTGAQDLAAWLLLHRDTWGHATIDAPQEESSSVLS